MSKLGAAFGGIIIGGLAGLSAGFLLAPKSGAETRADINDAAGELFTQGSNIYQDAADRVQSNISNIQPNINRRSGEMQEKIDNARAIIADQVTKNAAVAHEQIDKGVPFVTEKVGEAVAIAHEQIDKSMPFVSERVGEAATIAQGVAENLADKISPRKDVIDADPLTDAAAPSAGPAADQANTAPAADAPQGTQF